MYAGRFVEELDARSLASAEHPYTRALLACRPDVTHDLEDKPLIEIPGTVPALDRLPTGCAFMDRCERRQDICRQSVPPMLNIRPGHRAACFMASAPVAETNR